MVAEQLRSQEDDAAAGLFDHPLDCQMRAVARGDHPHFAKSLRMIRNVLTPPATKLEVIKRYIENQGHDDPPR